MFLMLPAVSSSFDEGANIIRNSVSNVTFFFSTDSLFFSSENDC
jgi:hypothetical protein